MGALAADTLGAVCCWLGAYALLRYRRNYAAWYARWQHGLAQQLWVFRYRQAFWYSPRFWQAIVVLAAGYFAAFGAGLWVAAAVQLLAVLRGLPPVPAPPAPPAKPQSLAEAASSLVPLIVGLFLCTVGVLTIVRRREAARYTQWQLFSDAPLDAAYPKGDGSAARPAARGMLIAATIAGVVSVAAGLFSLAHAVWLLLRPLVAGTG